MVKHIIQLNEQSQRHLMVVFYRKAHYVLLDDKYRNYEAQLPIWWLVCYINMLRLSCLDCVMIYTNGWGGN